MVHGPTFQCAPVQLPYRGGLSRVFTLNGGSEIGARHFTGQRYLLSDRGVTRGLLGVNPARAQQDAQSSPATMSELPHRKKLSPFVTTEEGKGFAEVVRQYSPEARRAKLDLAMPMIYAGVRLNDVAEQLRIAPRTLDYWLAQEEGYAALRRAWIVSRLTDADEQVELADNKLELLRAKIRLNSMQWWAERLDPARFAPKSEVTVTHDDPKTPEQVLAKIAELEQRLGIRTIDAEEQISTEEIISTEAAESA